MSNYLTRQEVIERALVSDFVRFATRTLRERPDVLEMPVDDGLSYLLNEYAGQYAEPMPDAYFVASPEDGGDDD